MNFLNTRSGWRAGLLLALFTSAVGQSPPTNNSTPVLFAPLEQWRGSILSGDQLLFRSFYSWNPEAVIQNPAGKTDSRDEIAFWNKLNVRGLKLLVLEVTSPKPGLQQVILQAEIKSSGKGAEQTLYVMEGQLWVQQGDVWRMIAVKRGEVTRAPQAVLRKPE